MPKMFLNKLAETLLMCKVIPEEEVKKESFNYYLQNHVFIYFKKILIFGVEAFIPMGFLLETGQSLVVLASILLTHDLKAYFELQ